jgi:signal transduction histidine kinase
LGKSKADSLTKHFFTVYPSAGKDGKLVHAIERAFIGIKSFLSADPDLEYRNHVEIHVLPLMEGVLVRGVMLLIHDVSHRIKAERELARLNTELANRIWQLKITSKELSLVTQAAGENVKDPLRKVYTGLENIIKSDAHKLSDSSKAILRRSQSALTKMSLLLDDIISVSQISVIGENFEQVNIHTVLLSVLNILKEKIILKNGSVEIGETCTIGADEKLLHQLLYHLIDNAIKFNESSFPLIRIECTETEINQDSFDIRPGIYKKLAVSDNGIGILDPEKRHIFGLFEKLHAGQYIGTGIGLAIAQKIMHAHAGFINMVSNAEGGSTFQCFFPS